MSTTVTVPGATGSWIDTGVQIAAGEALEVATMGVVQWAGSTSTSTTIDSVPATWTGLITVEFPIPAGTWVSAAWEFQGSGDLNSLTAETPTHGPLSGGSSGGTFSFSGAASAGQISDINAAAGGNLTVTFFGAVISTPSFTLSQLTLNGTPAAAYSLPEGAYPPSFPSSHVFDPSAVLQDSALTSAQQIALAAPGVPPFALALAVVPVGNTPPLGIGGALWPQRDTVFSANQIAIAGGGAGPWELWLICNDFDFADNAGAYDSTLTVSSPQGSFDMADRFTILNRSQLGKESTKGTVVPATILLQAVNLTPSLKTKTKKHRSDGSKRPDLSIATQEWSTASLDGIATYTELGWLLSSLVGAPVSSTPTTGVYQWTYISSSTAADTLQSFSVEHGSVNSAEGFGFGMVDSLAFKMTRDDIQLTGSMFGQIMNDSVNNAFAMSTGSSEVQSVTIASATGGTFTLSFKGQVTPGLAYNATTSAIQTALQALSTIGSGNALVTGSPGAYVVTFAGALASTPQPLLISNAASLTPAPPTSSAVVAMTTQGGMLTAQKIPILPGDVTIYIASTWAGLGQTANKVTRSFQSDFSIGNRTKPFWVQDGADDTSFAGYAEVEPKEMLDMMFGVDQAVALKPYHRSGTNFYIRIDCTSKEYTAAVGYPCRMVLDACVQVSDWKEFKDEDGIYALGYELELMQDDVAGYSYQIMLQNAMATY